MSEPTIGETRTSFLSLPSELRNGIYELLLVDEQPIRPGSLFASLFQPHIPTVDLLRANKTVHREASSILYGRNLFDFGHPYLKPISQFLDQIGINNTGHIRHIMIAFPEFSHLSPNNDHITMTDRHIQIIDKIRNRCVNLSTLTTSLDTTSLAELRLDSLKNYKIKAEALRLVDAHFRSIPSLQKIIVEAYEDGTSCYIRTTMEGLGWELQTVEMEEEVDERDCDRESDYDDYDRHDYDDFDNDNYYTEDDSDF